MHKLLGCYKDGIITSAVLRDHSLMGGCLVRRSGWIHGGKRWVVSKERSGSQLSIQSHQHQGYRPDTVSPLCPQHPHKSPDRQMQHSTSALIPLCRDPQGSLGMSLWPNRLPLGAPATTDYSGSRLTRICHVDLKTTCSRCEYIMKHGGTGCPFFPFSLDVLQFQQLSRFRKSSFK